MASGEEAWCQGWSEPNAGSDLAGIQARAVRDDAAGRLAAAGPEDVDDARRVLRPPVRAVPHRPRRARHQGLTYLLVDLRADGVTVRPVERLDGDEGFAEVFFDDAFVPDADVLGDVGRGWNVAMATTGSERGLTLRAPGRFMAAADRLIELARRVSAEADPDPMLLDRVTRVDGRAGLPLADLLDRDPPDRRRTDGRGVEPREAVLVGARRAPARDRARAARSARRAGRRRLRAPG